MAAIFGSTQPNDEFRASLIHAFHCRTPSCPVAGCESLTSKLGRLQQHVSSCTESYCLLCRIWTYLKCYQCAAPLDISSSHSLCRPVDAPSTNGLHTGSLAPAPLLPRWHPDGRISWVSPQEALTHLQALTSGTFDGARDGAGSEPPSKRHAGPGAVHASARHGAFDFATAHADYLASLQGVVPGARVNHAAELPRPTAPGTTPRVVPAVEPLESFNFDPLVSPLGDTPPLNSHQHFGDQRSNTKHGVGGAPSAVSSASAAVPGTSALPAAPPLFKGRHKRTLTSEPTRTSSTFARSASGLHVPLLNPLPSQAGQTPGMAPWMAPGLSQFGNGAHSGLGGSDLHAGGALVGSHGGGGNQGGGGHQLPPELKFEVMQGLSMQGSRSLNLSGNLADLLRSSSNLDLSLLGLGMSSSDLGSLGFRNDAKPPSSATDHFCSSPALTGQSFGLTDTPKLGGLPFARGQSFGLTDTPKLGGVPFARGQSFGLSLVRGRSGLDKCASEFSLSGFLNEEAMGGDQSSGSGGTSPPVDKGLNDIMNDFTGGSGPQHSGQRLVSA